eukprot:g3358.t1
MAARTITHLAEAARPISARSSMHARLHASNEKVIEMGVGLLPPDWLKGATYGGNETVRTASDEIRCHVWTKGHAMDNSTGLSCAFELAFATHPFPFTV